MTPRPRPTNFLVARSVHLTQRPSFHLPRRLASSTSSTTTAPPQQAARRPSPYGIIFSRAFAKVFFGAMFTYQLLYWAWEKLRIDEAKRSMLEEVRGLEEEVQVYHAKKDA